MITVSPDDNLGPKIWPKEWNGSGKPIPERGRLTKKRLEYALYLYERGFMIHNVGAGIMQRNRPLWALVELGLAEFDWGPRGSWLKTYGFMPVWSDPIC